MKIGCVLFHLVDVNVFVGSYPSNNDRILFDRRNVGPNTSFPVGDYCGDIFSQLARVNTEANMVFSSLELLLEGNVIEKP